ncbi:MAG: phosphoribosyltransferase family protein [Fimbriimonadales bacterium]
MTAVDIMRGAFDYLGAAGAAVRQLKFARAVDAAKPMGTHLRSAAEGLQFDYAVPVPIHWSRRSHRGFNQSELLAKHTGLPYRTNLISRTRATWPQARSKAEMRRSGLDGAFRAKPCPGARILLVDDVITSGGTVEACAQELKARGASWVGALAFAIELPSDFRLQDSGSSKP